MLFKVNKRGKKTTSIDKVLVFLLLTWRRWTLIAYSEGDVKPTSVTEILL